MAMQSCGKPELQRPVWRLRRPLTGRAKQGTKVQLRSPDFVQRQLCRCRTPGSLLYVALKPLCIRSIPHARLAHHAAVPWAAPQA